MDLEVGNTPIDQSPLIRDAEKDQKSTVGGSPPSSILPIAAAVVACMGSVAFGYQLGFTSPISALPSPPAVFGDQFNTFSSLVSIGAMGGGLSGGPLADLVGRRRLLLINAIPYTGAVLGMFFGQSIGILLLCRFIIGLCAGLMSLVVPLYVTETAPVHLRGMLGAGSQLGIVLGVFFAFVAGQPITSHPDFWRVSALIGLIPMAIHFAGMMVLPETPTWLLSKKKPRQDVIAALQRIRGNDYNCSAEIEVILISSSSKRSNVETSSDNSVNSPSSVSRFESMKKTLSALFSKRMRRQMVVAIGVQVTQQATGVNAVTFFSGHIFALAGTDPTTATIIFGGVQVVVTFISCLLLDKAGRRILLAIAATGMGLSELILGVCFFSSSPFPGWVSIVANCTYISFFAIAMGPVPWFITAEIFPPDLRGSAMSIATVVNWLGAFSIVQATLPLLNFSAVFTFWMFGGVCVLAVLFVMIFVPETKGKTYEEIEAEFNKK